MTGASAPTIPNREGDSCGDCHPDMQGGEWVHDAHQNDEGYDGKGTGWHAFQWVAGGCAENHDGCEDCYCPNICEGGPPNCVQECRENECGLSLQKLEDGIRSGLIDPVLYAQAYRRVELNTTRKALQVIGCGDKVIGHFPLPTTIAAPASQ
jgi:hypothetical protein